MSDRDKSLEIGFVLADTLQPRDGIEYPLVAATDPDVGERELPKSEMYLATVSVLRVWVDDLPDPFWSAKNEVLLKLSGRTRVARDPQSEEKVSAAVTFDFAVRDGRAANVDYRVGFENMILRSRLHLGIELIETDQGLKDHYTKFKAALGEDNTKEILNALSPVPYLDLATRVAEGLINAFGDGRSDEVWDALPALSTEPDPGMPFLRPGIYVVYEDIEADLRPNQLSYTDRRISRIGSAEPLDRNHLILSIGLKPEHPDEIAKRAL